MAAMELRQVDEEREMRYFLYLLALGVIVTYVVSRSSVGPRNKKPHPRWAEKIGDRDIPKVVRSDAFYFLGWCMRRLLPILSAMFVLSIERYLYGGQATFGLSSGDWLALVSLALAIYCAVMPFARKPRRGPLDKWPLFIFSVCYVVGGIGFALIQILLHLIGSSGRGTDVIHEMADWSQSHSLSETLGWSAGVVGLGLAMLALIESLPDWRPEQEQPKNLQEPTCLACGSRRIETVENKVAVVEKSNTLDFATERRSGTNNRRSQKPNKKHRNRLT